MDGHKAELAANTTTEYIIAQIDDKGHRFLHLYAIDDHRVIREELNHKDSFIISHNGRKRRRETYKGWDFFLYWEDRLSSWKT